MLICGLKCPYMCNVLLLSCQPSIVKHCKVNQVLRLLLREILRNSIISFYNGILLNMPNDCPDIRFETVKAMEYIEG